MEDKDVSKQIQQMVSFIRQEAEEKANEISVSAEEVTTHHFFSRILYIYIYIYDICLMFLLFLGANKMVISNDLRLILLIHIEYTNRVDN